MSTTAAASPPSHCVAVIGGAVAGAEVAGALAQRGVEVVVFEQNARPYGKIEDGLPRWHVALREKEYKTIGSRLTQPGVHFVPLTEVGRDVGFPELCEEWGFSGVVLANGAWRDRPLPVDGADDYVGKGLIYQNPFIIWFNHNEDASYDGPVFQPCDGALVVGGGLASIDVAKVLMLETTREMAARAGHRGRPGGAGGEGHPEDPGPPRPGFRRPGPRGLHPALPAQRGRHAADGDARRRRRQAPRQGAGRPREDARQGDGQVPLPLRAPVYARRAHRRGRPPGGPAAAANGHRERARRAPGRDLRGGAAAT